MPRVQHLFHGPRVYPVEMSPFGLGLQPPLLHLHHHLQYLKYSEPLELTACPLDLSVRAPPTSAPITPPCTPSPGVKREPSDESPKKSPEEVTVPQSLSSKKFRSTPNSVKKSKATRRLNFDEDTSSPVSGTIIRELDPGETLVVRKGDIDPAFNVVEVTEEAKAELAKIENVIGEYVCRLCRELYEDAFGLAQHRCSRIVHVEYRCPECDKVFNCPANLASHRRWHKPRPPKSEDEDNRSADESLAGSQIEPFPCGDCGKRFRRLAYLRKHQLLHQQSSPSRSGIGQD